jgi:hypothetical protein
LFVNALLTKKARETRLWYIDPSLFQPAPKAGFLELHIISRARSLAKHSLYLLAFAYPLVLVISGVMFGGLIFWAGFAGSMIIIWLILKKAGYSHNFESWDVGYKTFLGLIGAFGVYAGLIYGLEYVKIWTIPIFAGILILILIIGVRRAS